VHFWLGALRAVIELWLLCALGQAALALLAGSRREQNPIYRLFALLTAPPCRLLAACLPRGAPVWLVNALMFVLFLLLWLGIAFFRQFA